MQKRMSAALLALCVCGVCVGFTSCEKTSGKYMRYDNAERYTAGNAEILDGSVSAIEIEWLGGDIEIEQSADGVLRAAEDGDGLSEKARMQYLTEKGVLKIKYCRSGYCGEVSEGSKHLRLEIPRGIDLDIESTSAELTVGVAELNEISFESRSGNISAEKILCRDLDIQTQSGKILVGELSASEMELKSADGDIRVGLSAAMQGEIESKSGNVTLQLRGVGLQANFCTASGELITALPYEKRGGGFVFGKGENALEIKTKSGNLHVE